MIGEASLSHLSAANSKPTATLLCSPYPTAATAPDARAGALKYLSEATSPPTLPFSPSNPSTATSAPDPTMADSAFKTKTMKRKNVKGLALSAPPPKPAPSAPDAQIPGAIGHEDNRADTLEIGVEFQLDLRAEDLIVLRELGAGNGGTVSKVQHAATKVIMARKVSFTARGAVG